MQVKGARYLRVGAVAQMFDVSKATIYRAIRSGQLDAVRIGGSVRVPEAALRAFQGALDEVEPQRVAGAGGEVA